MHTLHVIGDGDPIPCRVDVPGLFQDLDLALLPGHELLVVRHPGVQERIGVAPDQVLVDRPNVVGELELDFFVAELIFEKHLRQIGVGDVLVPAKVAEREIPTATEPAARSEGPYYHQEQRGLQQDQEWPDQSRSVGRAVRPSRTSASP